MIRFPRYHITMYVRVSTTEFNKVVSAVTTLLLIIGLSVLCVNALKDINELFDWAVLIIVLAFGITGIGVMLFTRIFFGLERLMMYCFAPTDRYIDLEAGYIPFSVANYRRDH